MVTLDPLAADFEEEIDVIFAPPSQICELAESVDEDGESDEETPDPPEPIENGLIDLGKLATDALFLGLDPYPRKPDAVFEPVVEVPDPEEHPFAASKALKNRPETPKSKKPGRASRPGSDSTPRAAGGTNAPGQDVVSGHGNAIVPGRNRVNAITSPSAAKCGRLRPRP